MRGWMLTCGMAVLLAVVAQGQPEGPISPRIGGTIGLPMYGDPDVEVPPAKVVFDPRLRQLWLEALSRPEADLRWQAATAFGQAAEQNMPGLDAVVPVLIQRLREDDVPEVRTAAAAALATIGDASAAPAMLQTNRESTADAEMVQLTDPALAKWQHAPAYELWQQRVSSRKPVVVAASAARSLGAAGATEARELLLEVALGTSEHPMLRLASAEAIQAMGVDVPADAVQPLLAGSPVSRVVAARLLAGSVEPADMQGLEQLAQGDEPAAASVAAEAIATADPARMVSLGSALAGQPEPGVRRALVKAAAAAPSSQAIGLLVDRLDDPVTRVRTAAREALVTLAEQADWSQDIRGRLTQVVAGDAPTWRAKEQAALALGQLDHEPAADPLLAQLKHPRPEASLAAATALRQLQVAETLPRVLEHTQELSQRSSTLMRAMTGGGAMDMNAPTDAPTDATATRRDRGRPLTAHTISHQVSPERSVGADTTQLFMLMGELDYEPAVPLMRRYIPLNSPYDVEARAAAVWAMGKVYEGRPQPDLAKAFAERVADIAGMVPEADSVRQMAAVSIGRMGGDTEMATLQRFAREESGSAVGRAAQWAIGQITGEPITLDGPVTVPATGWFLEPLRR